MKVETIKMQKFFLDGAFFGINVILSGFLFMLNPGRLWIAFLVLWSVGGFVYPIVHKKIVNEYLGYLGGLMKILLMIFGSFLIGFVTFMIRTSGFAHRDWESFVFFEHYAIFLIIIVGFSFIFGRLLTNLWLRREK